MAVAIGAWWAHPFPMVMAVSAGVVAVAGRRPWLVVLAGLVLASTMGARAWSGLQPPTTGSFEGVVTLVADPRIGRWGTTVDVAVGGKRAELRASASASGAVASARAGERISVRGRIEPVPADAPWLVPRHVGARLSVSRAEAHDRGAWPWRGANRFRRLLQRGADTMGEPARSLYGGFVLGDQSGLSAPVEDDFRGAGLSHLLVVSGSNVAYLLVLLTPLKGRLPLGARWVVTMTVIATFALVTRFEPSILRASAMAAIAVSAGLAGRPSAPLRVMALAVAALIVIDPLLVHSVGFQLSVAATAGIVLGARPLARLLPGPEVFSQALAVTVAAQLAVAPLLIVRFGGVPVVSVPANLAAGPVAGLVTVWGLPAGVVAGLADSVVPGGFGAAMGSWLHRPTELAIEWVAGVARVSARLPLGELNGRAAVISTTAVALVLAGRRRGWPTSIRRVAAVSVVGAVMMPALALRNPPARTFPTPGVVLHRGGGATVVVFDGGADPPDTLAALRRAGVRRIDVAVMPTHDHEMEGALRHRWSVGRVVSRDRLDQAVIVTIGTLRISVGPGRDEPVRVTGMVGR